MEDTQTTDIVDQGEGLAPRIPANATCTVTGTVNDSSGIAWAYTTITAQLVNFVSKSAAPPTYTQDGTAAVTQVTGTADVNGNFSINLPRNDFLMPTGTAWEIAFQPAASSPPASLQITCDATALAIGATNFAPIRFALDGVSYGYDDSEVITPTPPTIAGARGLTYFNTVLFSYRAWVGNGFQAIQQPVIDNNLADLNNYTTTGTYFFTDWASNQPPGLATLISILQVWSVAGYVIQHLQCPYISNPLNIYIRKLVPGGGWQPWGILASTPA